MYRKLGLMFVAVGVSSVLATNAFAGREKGVLEKYVDGDSFWAEVEGESTEVRLIGADTPEAYGKPGTNQKEHATAASDFFKSQIKKGEEFGVERSGDFTHNRALAWIYPNGGNDELGFALVEKGYAVPYMYCAKTICANNGYDDFVKTNHVKEHLAACEQARKDEIGIWNKADKKKAALQDIPQEYRRKTLGKGEKTRYLIGDFNKKVYVAKGYTDYTEKTIGIDYCNRVLFDTEEHAKASGYKLVKAPVR